MSYVEKFQTLDREDAKQALFDSLNSRAMDMLSSMKNEGVENKELEELDAFDIGYEHGGLGNNDGYEQGKSDNLKESVSNTEGKDLGAHEAYGVKGMKNTPWRKTFKNSKAHSDWVEKNDATTYGTRDLDSAKRGNLSPAVRESLTEEQLDEMSQEEFDAIVEDYEQLDELSKKTLGDYINKAVTDVQKKAFYTDSNSGDPEDYKDMEKSDKRRDSISTAVRKLTKKSLDESIRKVSEYSAGRHKAIVHKDADSGEYRVKFHTDDKHLKDADYYTDDRLDAIGTAKHQVNAMHNSYQVDEGIRDGNYYHMSSVGDGKMPWGTDKLPKDISRHAYVKYSNNEPVEVKLHKGQDRVWNYKTSDMMSIGKPIKSWDGKRDLPTYKGKIVESSFANKVD